MNLFRFFNQWNERHYIRKCFRFDSRRYLSFSCPLEPMTKDQLRGEISIAVHVVEKGLTMPDMRWGFGRERIMTLLAHCEAFAERYDAADDVLLHAVSVLKEYAHRHDAAGIALDEMFQTSLSHLLSRFPDVPASEQPMTARTAFFASSEASFPIFSASRHSIRNFGKEPVPVDTLRMAAALAQNAPSACNRQATRIYIVQDEKLKDDILSLQNGNRGFGHLVDKLLVITSDLSYYKGGKSRNLCYVDAGIYAMNLLYSLHYYRVGACPLNWCDSPRDDAAIRNLIRIPEQETVVLLVACGSVPESTTQYASSQRIEADAVIHVL